MNKDNKFSLALFLIANKQNKHKKNLIDFLQEQICKYANQENTHAEQIKGMNRLLRDIIKLDIEVFNERNND